MIWRQLAPAPGPLGDRVPMDFEISGHGRDPLLAIKQSTERIEPISRTEWRWFGGRLARQLGRDRLLHVHWSPVPKKSRHLGLPSFRRHKKRPPIVAAPRG